MIFVLFLLLIALKVLCLTPCLLPRTAAAGAVTRARGAAGLSTAPCACAQCCQAVGTDRLRHIQTSQALSQQHLAGLSVCVLVWQWVWHNVVGGGEGGGGVRWGMRQGGSSRLQEVKVWHVSLTNLRQS